MTGGSVAAVVLAARGEAAVSAALENVAWAAERLVLDPVGATGTAPLPAGVRRVTDMHARFRAAADWALLLSDDEVVSPALAAEIGAAIAGSPAAAYALPRALAVNGGRLRLAGAPVRLVRAAEARLAAPRDGVLAWDVPHVRAVRLAEPLVVGDPGSLEAALRELDAETTALAGLPAAAAVRIGWRDAAVAPAAAAMRVLRARGVALGWERWIRAAFAGYRVLVLQVKRWERGQEAPL